MSVKRWVKRFQGESYEELSHDEINGSFSLYCLASLESFNL